MATAAKILGVAPASISKICGVAKASIKYVSGVQFASYGPVSDSYPESNQSSTGYLYSSSNTKVGQIVHLTSGANITKVRFYLRKVTGYTPSGNINCEIYASTGVGFGTNAVPNGSVLATSSNNVSASTLSTDTFALYDFNFNYNADAGYYALMCCYSGAAYVDIGIDNTSPTHEGNGALYQGSFSATSNDVIFYLS